MEALLAGLKVVAKHAAKYAARIVISRTARRRGGGGSNLVRALLGIVLLVVALPVLLTVVLGGGAPGGGGSCVKPPRSDIPEAYLPVYNEAAATFGINCYLLASIHQQESAFSTNPHVARGYNGCGAAGPAQMGVVGVAPYDPGGTAGRRGCSAGATWRGHWRAYRRMERARVFSAALRLRRDALPACQDVPPDVGCVYDDFEALAGAAHKLAGDGADKDLYSKGTHDAVCAYIGDCDYVDTLCEDPLNKYCDVLPRAQQWEKDGLVLAGAVVAPDGSWAYPTERDSEVKSGFKWRWGKPHTGIDIALPEGRSVFAWRTGRVTFAGWQRGYGWFTCIQHAADVGGGLESCYAHQSRFLVRAGDFVRTGQRIGLVGNTGHSFAPHLHFEIRTAAGVKLCPAQYIGLDPSTWCGAARFA
jgi:hypothetical protein